MDRTMPDESKPAHAIRRRLVVVPAMTRTAVFTWLHIHIPQFLQTSGSGSRPPDLNSEYRVYCGTQTEQTPAGRGTHQCSAMDRLGCEVSWKGRLACVLPGGDFPESCRL